MLAAFFLCGAVGASVTLGACGDDAGESSTSTGPRQVAADGFSITSIDVYQGVRSPLMENGAAAVSTIPLLSGRDAMVRVGYAVDSAYTGDEITVRLTLGTEVFEETLATVVPNTESVIDDLLTTVNFTIPGDRFQDITGYKVEFLQDAGGASGNNGAAQYPAADLAPLTLELTAPVRIMLIPIVYGPGGDRMPDTGAEQVQSYRDKLYSLYPASTLEVVVSEPFPWSNNVQANGNGWGTLLDSLVDLRFQTQPARHDYWYGLVSPANSFGEYCQGGCITGLSMLAAEPEHHISRVGIGVGFSGPQSIETAVHEIGHAHGRNHAPCGGPDNVDPAFPHSGGSIGEWGYDLIEKRLYDPANSTDYMGYCDPTWTSDYTFLQMLQRIRAVKETKERSTIEPKPYRRYMFNGEQLVERATVELRTPPRGTPVPLTHAAQLSPPVTTAAYYRYSHLAGGIVFVDQEAVMPGASIKLDGRVVTLPAP